MKRQFTFLLLLALLTSCGNKTQNSSEMNSQSDTTAVVENKIMLPVSTCYMGTMGKDTFQLKIEKFENGVTGNLAYLFHEKDRQTGTFEGKFMGDTLIADYSFASEGSISIRQIAFLVKDNKAVEGYGELEDQNGKLVYKNTRTLTFGSGLVLESKPCNQ